MKKIISFLIFGCSVLSFSQTTPSTNPAIMGGGNNTTNGLIVYVFDRFGKTYSVNDLKIPLIQQFSTKNSNITSTQYIDCGYFRLHLDVLCGFDQQTAIDANKRIILQKVFTDVSNFVNSPLTANGNKVNIRIVNPITANLPQGVLGFGTSVYTTPTNFNSNNANAVLDNEVWKTIHLGIDSFSGNNIYNSTTNNNFYHGSLGLSKDPGIDWNTSLTNASTANQFDLYSTILHEVTHLLGFESLIIPNNQGDLNPFLQFFSRYDTFLKSNNSNTFLINSTNCYPTYNNITSVQSLIHPGCSTLNSGIPLDITDCNNAIKYVGLNNGTAISVYTPTCFEKGSSISHFEDLCYPTNNQPYGNDLYFNMSNMVKQGSLHTKRYLKPLERAVLIDLGYSVNNTFGSTSTPLSYFNYGGTINTGITVAGLNDGLIGNRFQYIVEPGVNIDVLISSILSNDTGSPTSISCLDNTTLSATNTLSQIGNTIKFSSQRTGLHFLSYRPEKLGQKGNITYIYIYVQEYNYNGIAPADCNLIINGNFEQHSNILAPPSNNHINGLVSGWKTVYPDTYQKASYFHPDVTPNSIPCSSLGYQTENQTGTGYIGTVYGHNLKTKLKTVLLPNKQYRLTFDLSLADSSRKASNIQAYLSSEDITLHPTNFGVFDTNLPIPASMISLLKTNSSPTTNKNSWEPIIFDFNTGSNTNLQYLYIGGLKDSNVSTINLLLGPTNISGCTINDYPICYYFLDNVELFPVITPTITGSASACLTLSNANTTTNSTTLLSGQTASWAITGGTGTLTGATTTTANVTWTTLPGTLILTITDTATGCTKSTTRTIASDCNPCSCLDTGVWQSVAPKIAGNPSSYCLNNNTCPTYGLNLSYVWSFTNGTTLTTVLPCISEIQNGNLVTNNGVKIKILDSNNNLVCSRTFSNVIINNRTSQVNYPSIKNLISITPNPSNGIYNLNINDYKGDLNVQVFDFNGRLIHKEVNVDFDYEKIIDLTNLQSGIYLLKIEGKNISFSQKLIKN